MKEILLSINPEHVNNIFNNTKKYEFRKIRCKSDVSRIYIYCTCPIMKIVGEARVKNTIVDSPENVWGKTRTESGIDKEFFDNYYKGHDTAVAYELSDVVQYEMAKDLSEFGLKAAPQSFVYVNH